MLLYVLDMSLKNYYSNCDKDIVIVTVAVGMIIVKKIAIIMILKRILPAVRVRIKVGKKLITRDMLI